LFSSLDKYLLLILYTGIIGYIFTPIWFFQGLEKLKYITIITAFSKLILLVLTFLFVKNREDYLTFAFLNSLSFIFSGIIGTYYISRYYPLKISQLSFKEIKYQLRIGFPTFVSTIAYSLYSNTNIVLLGILAGEKAVAIFSVAKKLMDILTNLYSVLSKVVYPRVSELFFKSRQEALTLLKRIYIPVISLTFVFVSILLTFPFISNVVIDLLFGKEYIESAKVFRILSVSFLLLVVNNLINVQILLALGYNSTYGRIMAVTSVFSLISGFVLIKNFGYMGLAYNFVITEVITLIQSLFFLQRRLRRIA
jgi:O-antigen/teichoic acid export membrane protein